MFRIHRVRHWTTPDSLQSIEDRLLPVYNLYLRWCLISRRRKNLQFFLAFGFSTNTFEVLGMWKCWITNCCAQSILRFFRNNDEITDSTFDSCRIFILPSPRAKFYAEEVRFNCNKILRIDSVIAQFVKN